ncbi:MAG: hypothetical protein RSE58_08950 [Clostridia bacterium]
MQSVLPVLATALLSGAVILILFNDSRHERHLRLRVNKFRNSELFQEMLPLLRSVEHRPIEQLVVDKTGVVIRCLQPVGAELAFLMKPHHYAYLTPEQQEAVRVVLEGCLPKLKDSSRYCLHRKRIRLINGDIEYNWHYTIVNAYKTKLTRAPYYDGSLQTHLW